jgi:hypothetical protein
MKRLLLLTIALAFCSIMSSSQWTYAEDTKAERFSNDFSQWMDNMKVEITEEEREALREVHHLFYKLTEDQFFLKYYSKFFWNSVRQSGYKTIEWEKAQELILKGEITSVSQTHSLDVTLTGLNGQRYKTNEPRIDEVWYLVDQVDPKGVFILFMTE